MANFKDTFSYLVSLIVMPFNSALDVVEIIISLKLWTFLVPTLLSKI